MIAVDANILVYVHREDSPWHEAAFACLAELAESRAAWAIPWPCLHEFLAIVTHPQIYSPPSPRSPENHPNRVIPAQAGIHCVLVTWTPAYAGVTP